MGSMTASTVEGTYHDVDALVATGFSNVPHPLPVSPADLAPLLTGPYATLPSFIRTPLFYNPPFADPVVIDFDNANLNNAVPRGQFFDVFGHTSDPTYFHSDQVTIPVLVQLGEFDALYPAAVVGPGEAATWPLADITVEVVANSGHDLNLHIQHQVAWGQIDSWLGDTLSHRRACGCHEHHDGI